MTPVYTIESETIRVFNKPCLRSDWEQADIPDFFRFTLTDEGYKASWQASYEKASPEDRAKLFRLPNFDADVFFDLTGIDVRSQVDGESKPAKLDQFGCVRNTIKVSAGHYVDLLNPNPDSIEIETIADALSKICRFGGHCPRFYSVAEHCVHAVKLAAADEWEDSVLVAILLHDAAEAYVGDMVKPLKNLLPGYVEAEKRIETAISKAFGTMDCHDIVKKYDRAMLKAEKLSMWPDDHETWNGLSEIETKHIEIQFLDPDDARDEFLSWAQILAIGETSDA